ncbi:MAG: DUF1330 domain-containing protein [Rhizobiaceae bacterium]|nr:DUF1330 domain-containing protein [Rhizobiaceae bacterium]
MNNYIDPDKERFAHFKQLPRDQPIQMLNLVQLKATAQYNDGTMITGREAYSAYSRESFPIFERLGGQIIWSGSFEMVLIGPAEKSWDICFIAQYPNADAFIQMIRDADYQKAVKHRQAAVSDSRLIRFSPRNTGDGFG